MLTGRVDAVDSVPKQNGGRRQKLTISHWTQKVIAASTISSWDCLDPSSKSFGLEAARPRPAQQALVEPATLNVGQGIVQ